MASIEVLARDLQKVIDSGDNVDYTYCEVIAALELLKTMYLFEACRVHTKKNEENKENTENKKNTENKGNKMKKKIFIAVLLPFFLMISCNVMRGRTVAPVPGQVQLSMVKSDGTFSTFSEEFLKVKIVPKWLKKFKHGDSKIYFVEGATLFVYPVGDEVYNIELHYPEDGKVQGMYWSNVDLSDFNFMKSFDRVEWLTLVKNRPCYLFKDFMFSITY